MNSELRKAGKRYVAAVKKLDAAALARFCQNAVVELEQAELARHEDAMREASAEVERAAEDIVTLVERKS